MTEEVMIKTHLIVDKIYDEFDFNWCGKLDGAKPVFKNDRLAFVIVGTNDRMEVNTFDFKTVENCAKKMTRPKGRSSVTQAKAFIYLKEENEKERLMCVMEHRHIKEYKQMYDAVGYRK